MASETKKAIFKNAIETAFENIEFTEYIEESGDCENGLAIDYGLECSWEQEEKFGEYWLWLKSWLGITTYDIIGMCEPFSTFNEAKWFAYGYDFSKNHTPQV